ncbi:MAG: N-acetyltransferase [Oscillospiraceae bacterium]
MIRKFGTDDLQKIMEIWLNTNINAHNFIDKQYWLDNYKMVESIIPQSEIFVIEENNEICGFIGLNDGYIEGIFVAENHQSKGFGKQLLDYAKSIYQRLSLSVYKNNIKAISFYNREGFSIIKQQTDENTQQTEYEMIWTK